MRKLVTTVLCWLIFLHSFAQTQRKVSAYLLTQYNSTLYDYTVGNNPWGAGLGVQTFLNNKTNWKPTIEITGDVYLADDKLLRLNPDGSIPKSDNSVGGMVNLFAGSSFHFTPKMYVSLLAGPSFISRQTFFGIKPSFGFYFSKSQRWMAKVSYINVFNRTQVAKKDFGSVSFAIGYKLF